MELYVASDADTRNVVSVARGLGGLRSAFTMTPAQPFATWQLARRFSTAGVEEGLSISQQQFCGPAFRSYPTSYALSEPPRSQRHSNQH